MFQLFDGEQMKQAKVLSSEELKRVIAICSTMQNGKRNRLMLMLSHYAGMRVGEIASLKWTDVLDKDLIARKKSEKLSSRNFWRVFGSCSC
ncbi:tyrosine-type recombinase/integrase [Ascidiaceihabitans sp.]|uniref:tyrosine-type recombinase/integrase n=1 Tax=Ascidiaceihabitans sp. TaxID=1872644 RepID=UPI00329A73F9